MRTLAIEVLGMRSLEIPKNDLIKDSQNDVDSK